MNRESEKCWNSNPAVLRLAGFQTVKSIIELVRVEETVRSPLRSSCCRYYASQSGHWAGKGRQARRSPVNIPDIRSLGPRTPHRHTSHRISGIRWTLQTASWGVQYAVSSQQILVRHRLLPRVELQTNILLVSVSVKRLYFSYVSFHLLGSETTFTNLVYLQHKS